MNNDRRETPREPVETPVPDDTLYIRLAAVLGIVSVVVWSVWLVWVVL